MEDNNYDKEGFLRELTELSRKHGLYIGGCGCCGSPYISTNKDHDGAYVFDFDGGRITNLEWV